MPLPPPDFEGIRYENGKPVFYFSQDSKKMFAEIRDFEKTIGRRWWENTGVEKRETWASFKRRGCPLDKPSPFPAPTPVQAPSIANTRLSDDTRQNPAPTITQRVLSDSAKPKPVLRSPLSETIKGVEITRSPSGRCTLFGIPTSRIFQWAGSKGWTFEQCLKLVSVLKLEGVAESSIALLVKVGSKGKAGKAFKFVELSKTQEKALSLAIK